MKFATSTVLLILRVGVVCAWMGRPTVENVGSQVSRDLEAALVGKDAFNLLPSSFLSTTIRNPESDCQSRLIATLKLSCHNTESERIGVSIALTLCSIASARQQSPTECKRWEPARWLRDGGMDEWNEMPGDGANDVEIRGRCLEALHRSPQDWSSYNGYLSQAMQLCHALQGAQQQEMARSIYVNITHEKMALLKYMRGNEERKAQEQGALQVSLQENIEKALSRIQDSAKQQFGTLSTLIAQFEKNDANAHTQLRETALRMRDAGEGLWDEVRVRTQREMEVSAEGGRKVLDDQVREMRYMMDALLHDTAEKHDAGMQSLALQNQQQFEIAMTQNHIRFGQMMDDRVALFTDGFRVASEELSGEFSRHHESLRSVSTLTKRLPLLLEIALDQTQALQELQAKGHSMIQETVNLTEVLDEKLQATLRMASASHVAFEEFKEEIAYSRYSTTGISFWRLMEFTGTFLPYFASPAFVALKAQPIFNASSLLASTLGAVIFNAIAVAFYSITTVWVLFRTGIWRLAKRACQIVYTEYAALRDEQMTNVERRPVCKSYAVKVEPEDYRPPTITTTSRRPLERRVCHVAPERTQMTTRKVSFGRRIDHLARRAQSEPPL